MATRGFRPAQAGLLLAGLICLCLGTGFTQDFRATLNGTVMDSSGGVIPGATVQVRNTATGEVSTMETSNRGDFTAPFLRPGDYTVTAEFAGLKKWCAKTSCCSKDRY